MTIVAVRLTIPSDDIELGQMLHDGEDTRIELTQLVPTGDSVVPYFWVETDAPSLFEETARSDDRVATLERLEDGPDKYLYRIEWATDINGFFGALAAHSLVVESAVGGPEEWRFQLRGPDHDNLSAFRETLQDHGISSTINRVWNPRNPNGDPYGLTAKQREAIELAFTEGYFHVPSETNLTELAETIGITRQSFSRRLNRGIHQVLGLTVMAES